MVHTARSSLDTRLALELDLNRTKLAHHVSDIDRKMHMKHACMHAAHLALLARSAQLPKIITSPALQLSI